MFFEGFTTSGNKWTGYFHFLIIFSIFKAYCTKGVNSSSRCSWISNRHFFFSSQKLTEVNYDISMNWCIKVVFLSRGKQESYSSNSCPTMKSHSNLGTEISRQMKHAQEMCIWTKSMKEYVSRLFLLTKNLKNYVHTLIHIWKTRNHVMCIDNCMITSYYQYFCWVLQQKETNSASPQTTKFNIQR